jgi:hypothetical protein
MEVQDTLERIFLFRGYEIVRTSVENSYLLLKKGSSTMAVGYTMPGEKVTDGEADMFISMSLNDGADSMLFISPMRMPSDVKRTFEKEKVATWDRAALTIAIGEQVLNDWSRDAKERRRRDNIMELFQTEDVDPVKEVKEFHREVSEKDLGGFTVKEVELRPGTKRSEKETSPARIVPDLEPPVARTEALSEEVEPSGTPPQQLEFDLGGLPMMEPVDEKPSEGTPEKSRRVPDEVLMNPWAGFSEWKDKGPDGKEGEILETKLDDAIGDGPWKGSVLAPVKYSEKDALSLAGEEHEFELERSNQPFLLLRATYSMRPEDGQEPVEMDGTYLYDTVRYAVHDLPEPLFKEVEGLKVQWDGKDGPNKLPDLKNEHNNAVMSLRKKIQGEKLAKDRKVRETQMSTIYREISYRFDPSSLRLHSSKRVMVPFWIKTTADGKVEWEVNAYLGRLVQK